MVCVGAEDADGLSPVKDNEATHHFYPLNFTDYRLRQLYILAGVKSKKVNPRRRPASQADVKRAKAAAMDEAVTAAWAIFFTVLRDKENAANEDLQRIWKEVEGLSDSINQGFVNVADLRRALEDEAGIVLK